MTFMGGGISVWPGIRIYWGDTAVWRLKSYVNVE
jgi:hypothetical protein